MEMFVINSEALFYRFEELQIMSEFIDNSIIFDKDFFSQTDNFISIHTIYPSVSPVLSRIVFCRGEKCLKRDENLAYMVLKGSVEQTLQTLIGTGDDFCKIFLPVQVENMYLLISVFKCDDMYTFVLCKTKADPTTGDLNKAVAGSCALLHIFYEIFAEMQEDGEPPEAILDGYIDSETDRQVAAAIKFWFDQKPKIVQEWLKQIAKEERESQDDDNE